MRPVNEQLDIIKRGAVDVVPEDLLVHKLQRSAASGKPLIVKQGFDPTAPDIHLGHTVGLRKLRQFQDLGHQVVFLVGDFTGLIGDPSGRSETRARMSREVLVKNAETYTEQAFKILDRARTRIEFNSSWLAKLNFVEVLSLTATQTVARMLERDDFEKRFKSNEPISLLEFVYPLAQGYDSVALHADVELGGTDQKFNLLMAREIQRDYGQEPQVILTLPLLVGTDGVKKMSKSLGNYIGITEPAGEMFGKTMSIPDGIILTYFELVSSKGPAELESVRARLKDPTINPSHVKRELARDIVAQYHGEDASKRAEAEFDRIHVQHDAPENIEEVVLDADPDGLWVVKALTGGGLCKSSSDARRMIQQGAVTLDGDKLSDVDLRLARRDAAYTLKVGKRHFVNIRVR
ncbi:MAG: tyrosyl-tRNA synthetase [Candidatus Krumholzibacteriota bacterium]|nr:tyrosyl-tRNA synthetase [Candidatus Krumholzibacteriota bacterium]